MRRLLITLLLALTAAGLLLVDPRAFFGGAFAVVLPAPAWQLAARTGGLLLLAGAAAFTWRGPARWVFRAAGAEALLALGVATAVVAGPAGVGRSTSRFDGNDLLAMWLVLMAARVVALWQVRELEGDAAAGDRPLAPATATE